MATTNTLEKPQAYDPTTDIDKLKQAQTVATLAQLQAKRDAALSSLNAEKADIQPRYYNSRTQATTGSQLQAKNFAEYMAGRGQTNSGTSAQAELSRNVGLQNQIGNLNTQEQSAYDDIARRITEANNAYNSDLTSGISGIEANATNQLINARQQNYANQLNQYNTDRNYNYQQGRDNTLDTRYNNEWNYNVGRDKIADTRYGTEYKDKLAQQQWENNLAMAQWNWQKAKSGSSGGSGGSGGSSGGSRGSSSGKMTTAQKTAAKTSYADMVTGYMQQGNVPMVEKAIFGNRESIINDLGQSYYNTLEKQYNTWTSNSTPYQNANTQLKSAVYQGIDDPGQRRFINGQKVGY